MTFPTQPSTSAKLVSTIDVRELRGIRWGIMRQMFPKFVEEAELGRYLRALLSTDQCDAVRVEPHRAADGRQSTHIFDVYRLNQS